MGLRAGEILLCGGQSAFVGGCNPIDRVIHSALVVQPFPLCPLSPANKPGKTSPLRDVRMGQPRGEAGTIRHRLNYGIRGTLHNQRHGQNAWNPGSAPVMCNTWW